MRDDHVSARTPADASRDPDWTSGMRNPFHHPRYLDAVALEGPGDGAPLCLEARAEGIARWGVVERRKLGLRGAVSWDAPDFTPGADRERAWRLLLDALARRGTAVLRMNCITTLRWSEADVEAVSAYARERGWATKRGEFGTYVVDLTQPESEAWHAMAPSHRRDARHGEKAGVEIEELSGADDPRLREFVAVVEATFARQGLQGPSREHVERLAGLPTHIRYFLARDPSGVVQAADSFAICGKRAIGMHGGSGRRAVKGAGTWTMWRIMRALARDGVEEFDLGGVDLVDEHSHSAGVRDFKRRFGGRLERYASLDVVFAPVKTRLIEHGRRIAARVPFVRA